nr:uncharacterized mitochondrial protein AtMg00810-like [Tanacetum cinerariifolium]
ESKLKEQETPKKPQVKYFEQNRQSNNRPKGNQRNWNNLKSYQLGQEFVLHKKPCFNCGDFSHLAKDCRRRVQRETNRSQNLSYKSSMHKSAGHRPNGAHMRPPLRSSGPRPHRNYMRPPFRPAGHRLHGPSINPRKPTMNGKAKKDGIFISQDKYVAEILRKFRLSEGKSASTPIDVEKPLLKDTDGLWYPKDLPFDLVAYSDSDYAGASLDRKSTTGGCQFLGCRLISWQCKKQTVVATSSTEAEYVAAASGCPQVLWMQNQLLDYGVFNSPMLHVLRVEMVINSPWLLSKNWLVQKQMVFGQTTTGKESSNPFMAASRNTGDCQAILWWGKDSKAKRACMVVQEWGQEVGKGSSFNNFSIVFAFLTILFAFSSVFLALSTETALDFSGLRHASRFCDVTRLQALVDKKNIVISEVVIREILQLDDTEGVVCLPNEEIFAGLAQMGYEKPSTKLTFYKAFFSSQWKFLIHTILQSLSAKRTSWNEFSTAMASAVICLLKGQRFNISKYIFDSLVRNVDSSSKFYMYPHFIQLIIQNQVGDLSTHTTRFISPALTQKVFANMRRVGKGFSRVETPLFEGMLAVRQPVEEGVAEAQVQVDDVVIAAVEENVAEDVTHDAIPSPPPHDIPSPSQEPSSPPQQPQSLPQALPQGAEFPTQLQQVLNVCSALTKRVENLENDNAAQNLLIIKLKARVKRLEKANMVKSSKLRRLRKVGASKQVESFNDMEDIEIYSLDLDHSSKVLKVVTAAASQVSDASATILVASATIPAAAPTVVAAYTKRRKGVIIRDPEEELSLKTPAETPKVKDKGKGILVETPKPMKKKDQIELDAEYARKLHEEINRDEFNKDIDWDAAMDHINQKSNNLQYIKRYQGMKKRPQTESEARKNMMIYLKNTAGYKMDFFKGMTYAQICPNFQARFDENMRKLSEEAQEAEDLRKRLEVVEDEDDDVFIEATLLESKTMFEEPDGQDSIWRNQKSVHGLALVKSWKLLASCGVHVITLSTVQLFLLVERRYPLLRFTLEQLVNVTRLQVEEESEISLELLRKVLVINYEIVMINNKPSYKIFREDDTHQLYTSFITLLKNFNREDLEDLWKIVKARFSTLKPTNFFDDYLLATLKYMFEITDRQDALWRNQQTKYGQALVKS